MTKPMTNKELDVLYLLNNGLTNTMIASAMSISTNTVKVHKYNLYKKLEVSGLGKSAAKKELEKFCSDHKDLFEGFSLLVSIKEEHAEVTGETALA